MKQQKIEKRTVNYIQGYDKRVNLPYHHINCPICSKSKKMKGLPEVSVLITCPSCASLFFPEKVDYAQQTIDLRIMILKGERL